MSWFTDLAGKAESLLNNIDQSAAGAIKKSDTLSSIHDASTSSHPAEASEVNAEKITMPLLTSVSDSNFRKHTTRSPVTDQNTSRQQTRLDSTKTKTMATKDKDDALFDFLNSTDKPTAPRSSKKNVSTKSRMRKSISSTSVTSDSSHHSHRPNQIEQHKTETGSGSKENKVSIPTHASFNISRSSSIDSMSSKQAINKFTVEGSSHSSEGNEPSSEADIVSYPMDTASESEFELVSNTAVSSAGPSERDSAEENQESGDRSMLANVQMENKLLQNEITALHQEMKSMSERNLRSKTELERYLSDAQRKYDDLSQQYNVKNSQSQAMMMQINDLENENQSMKRSVDSLKTEKQRIIGDQTAGSDMHAQAMDQLRIRLEEAESSLIREKDSNRSFKEEALYEREKQEEEMRKLADSLRKSEAEKHAQKKRLEDVTKEISNFQGQLAASQHEMSDYKQKATRILQSKERLIASLKGGNEADFTASTTASIELEEVRQERDSVKEDLIAARSEVLKLKHDLQEIEGQYQQENSVLQEEIDDLRRSLDGELRSRKEAEKDVNKYENEMRREREEATRVRAAANERLQDKEEEVAKLRNQLMMRSRSSPEESELESRLHQLTETLLQKQTIVETISAEKSSLVLQLERAEGQIKRLSQENSTRLQMPSDSGENGGIHNRGNVNSAMFEFSSGSTHGVVGHVKKAASAVDRFSVRLGVFLRRYPVARLFVIVYMGLLHLWVMIVLLTYSPEIHGQEYHNNEARRIDDQIQPHVDHGLPKDS